MTNRPYVLLLLAATLAAPARAAQDDVVQARGIIEAAVKDYPKNAELRVHLGFIYKKLGLTDDAQREFEESARLEPAKAEASYMLGLLYEKKGLREKARAAWKACAENATEEGMKETAQRHLHLLDSTGKSDAKP
jgi:tetratricopeptide (TPR) repeat protein